MTANVTSSSTYEDNVRTGRRNAVMCVCANATNGPDAVMLLAMLGLDVGEGRQGYTGELDIHVLAAEHARSNPGTPFN